MIKTSMPTDTRETLTVLTVDRIVGGERREPPLSCRNGEIRKGIKEKERKREREREKRKNNSYPFVSGGKKRP